MANNKGLGRWFQLLLIIMAGGSIFPLIYLRQSYQDVILEVYKLSPETLNNIFVVLGIVYVVGYFPSGIISDKFSAKKLLVISLIGTGVGGLWFAQVPPESNIFIIFAIWGFFSVFTFWSAHMKLVKLLSTPEDEGRFFGILDGGRGLVEAIFASIAVVIFKFASNNGGTTIADKTSGITSVVYMYSILLLVTAVLAALFIKEDSKDDVKIFKDKTEKVEEKEKFEFKDIGLVFRNKLVFLLGAIIFLAYSVTWVFYYFNSFLTSNIQISTEVAATVIAIALYMRPIGGITGGFLADKFGKGTVLITALIGAAIAFVVLAISPVSSPTSLFIGFIMIGALFIYTIRGVYWSLLGEIKIDARVIGISIGLVSLIGYVPDIILPKFINALFKAYGDNGGYNAYFISSAIAAVLGAVLVVFFVKAVKKEKSLNK